MRRTWYLNTVTRKLAAVLLAASLTLAIAAQAGASQQAGRTSPESVAVAIYLTGGCHIHVQPGTDTVHGWMRVDSDEYGTGYVNVYKRTSSGNLLVSRATASGRHFGLDAYEPRGPYTYFATYGFNATTGSRSGSDNC
jgi:hypothetical protein